MTETTTIVPAPRKGRKAVVSRTERRELAWREAGKDSHDRLTAAVQQWAAYSGEDRQSPTQSTETYYKIFKRMMYARLDLSQGSKRDDLSRTELVALAAMEEVVTAVLIDGMNHRKPRDLIKCRYAQAMKEVAAAHLPALQLERKGAVDEQ